VIYDEYVMSIHNDEFIVSIHKVKYCCFCRTRAIWPAWTPQLAMMFQTGLFAESFRCSNRQPPQLEAGVGVVKEEALLGRCSKPPVAEAWAWVGIGLGRTRRRGGGRSSGARARLVVKVAGGR
jgi:hypothetical protein